MRVPQVCPREIKFGRLLFMAREKDFDPAETIYVGFDDLVFISELTETFYPNVRFAGVRVDVIR